jgi:hypothetical protein
MDTKPLVIDLFLCHNGADKDWVRQLGEQVESESFDGAPTGRPMRVFFDEWDIDVGQNVLVRINQGLSAARYVGVVISPEMLQAPWPTLEWTHVVADDPTNRKGRLVPLFSRDYSEKMQQRADLPAPFKTLNWIDFRKPTDFNRSFLRLVRKLRDQPPVRGLRRRPLASLPASAAPLPSPVDSSSAAPDRVDDIILGNLLPVQSYPSTVWSAPTEARLVKDVFEKVEAPSAFELQGKRLYSFADLSDLAQPLRATVSDGEMTSHAVAWMRDDPARWRWFVSLLNRCLKNHLRSLPLFRDDRGRFFFRPKDGGARVWRNGSDRPRTVADKKVSPSGDKSFWVHQGAKLYFQPLGDRLFLCIDPCYVFTSDGRTLLTGKSVTSLASKWGGKERNAAILRHVAFWIRTLSGGRRLLEVETGGAKIIISGVPALAKTTFGVEADQINIRTLLAQMEDELSLAADAVSEQVFASELEKGDEEDEHDD